jgi:outer membrane protein insertion porin family
LDIGLSHGDVVGSERYMLGGKDTLRGYGDWKFASKNKFLFNSEYRFPIIKEREDSFLKNFFTFNRLNGAAFFEAGLPWDKRRDIDLSNVKTDVGLGLRFEITVLGFFEKTFNRIDVGFPLDGKSVPHIWFEVTNAF